MPEEPSRERAYAPFTTFIEAQQPAIVTELAEELTRRGIFREQARARGMLDGFLARMLEDLTEPMRVVALAEEQIAEGNQLRAARRARGLSLDESITVLNGLRRSMLRAGLEAVSRGIAGAAEGLTAAVSVLDHVTVHIARVHAELEIEREHRLRVFKRMADRSMDGVVISDVEGNITYVNHSAASASGTTPELMIGLRNDALVDPADLAARGAEIRASIMETGAWRGRLRAFRADGEPRSTEVLAIRLVDDDGTEIGIATMFRDVTDVDATEERMRELREERSALQEQVIEAQHRALRELSVPLIPLARGLLLLPLIGSIDARRAAQITEVSLYGIREFKAPRLILDITGVSNADAQVVDALLRTSRAARLLGARVMLTGVQPAVARTFVELGADLRDIVTHSTLEEGVRRALALTAR
jgi:PAS domain S-box-containing protein